MGSRQSSPADVFHVPTNGVSRAALAEIAARHALHAWTATASRTFVVTTRRVVSTVVRVLRVHRPRLRAGRPRARATCRSSSRGSPSDLTDEGPHGPPGDSGRLTQTLVR